MSTLECAVTDCPFNDGGACLEAFEDPTDCPNTSENPPDEVDTQEIDDDLDESGIEGIQVFEPGFVSFESGESLGLSQANDLRAERQSRFVLLAGEVKAGKSTLLIELFAKFLKGPYEGWDFAGSRTLGAFDRAHAPARESSGRGTPDTARTSDEGMRFLHLRLGRRERIDLLLSELSGERFKGLIDGASVRDQVPIADVAERCLLLVDGNLMSAASTRSRVFARARRLVGALTEPGGLRKGTPVLVLATKSDLWDPMSTDFVRADADALVDFARERGLDASWEAIAARPIADNTTEMGMPGVLSWMLESEEPDVPAPAAPQSLGRRFWQDRHE